MAPLFQKGADCFPPITMLYNAINVAGSLIVSRLLSLTLSPAPVLKLHVCDSVVDVDVVGQRKNVV